MCGTHKESCQPGIHIWAQVFVPVPNLPSPNERERVQITNGGWKVKWTALPEASQACCELLRCGCKNGCKCVKVQPIWKMTYLEVKRPICDCPIARNVLWICTYFTMFHALITYWTIATIIIPTCHIARNYSFTTAICHDCCDVSVTTCICKFGLL